jgi:hypothetical protein
MSICAQLKQQKDAGAVMQKGIEFDTNTNQIPFMHNFRGKLPIGRHLPALLRSFFLLSYFLNLQLEVKQF